MYNNGYLGYKCSPHIATASIPRKHTMKIRQHMTSVHDLKINLINKTCIVCIRGKHHKCTHYRVFQISFISKSICINIFNLNIWYDKILQITSRLNLYYVYYMETFSTDPIHRSLRQII